MCNKYAYDNVIKFIPYDNVIIDDNNHNTLDFDKYWTLQKIGALKHISAPFVHIDGDVMLFKDVLKPFDYDIDIICQNIENASLFKHYNFYNNLLEKELKATNLLGEQFKTCNPINCGVIGIRDNDIKELLLEKSYYLYKIADSKYRDKLDSTFPIYLEQYVLGTIVKNNSLKVHDVLNDKLIKQYGICNSGNRIGYTHLWGNSKFKLINVVKAKILASYEFYYKYVECYEHYHKMYY